MHERMKRANWLNENYEGTYEEAVAQREASGEEGENGGKDDL